MRVHDPLLSLVIPPGFPAPDLPPSANDLANRLIDLAKTNTANLVDGVLRSGGRRHGAADADDFMQNTWLRLVEWLQDPEHRSTADALLKAGGTDAIKFMQAFSSRRICDFLDYQNAFCRDRRNTIYTEDLVQGMHGWPTRDRDQGDLPHPADLHLLKTRPCHGPEGDRAAFDELREQVRKQASFRTLRLFDLLANPPEEKRKEIFALKHAEYTGVCRLHLPPKAVPKRPGGRAEYQARLCLDGHPTVRMVRSLRIDWHPSFPENLPVAGQIESTHGPAECAWENTGTPRLKLKWPTNLYVEINDLKGRKCYGTYRQVAVTPSEVINFDAAARLCGCPASAARRSWRTLRKLLGARGCGLKAPKTTHPEPRRKA